MEAATKKRWIGAPAPPSAVAGTKSPGAILDDAQRRPRRGEAQDGPSNSAVFARNLRHLRRRGTSLCLVPAQSRRFMIRGRLDIGRWATTESSS